MAERGSERIAVALRGRTEPLDPVREAERERALLAAVRFGDERRRTWVPRASVTFALGAAALAAVALLWMFPDSPRAPRDGLVMHRGGHAEALGPVLRGGTVETGPAETASVTFGKSRIEVSPGSRARFERLDPKSIHLVLEVGRIDVGFHPERRGEQRMLVEAPHARVEVVGTVFHVRADGRRTEVGVREGVVRVVDREGTVRMVRAGEHVEVVDSARDTLAWVEAANVPSDRGVSDEIARDREGTPAPEAEQPVTEAGPRAASAAPEAAPLSRALARDGVDGDGRVRRQAAADATASGRELAPDVRFDLAETLLERGQLREGRHELHAIARTSAIAADRARAWVLIGDSWMREQSPMLAADAYRRGAHAGRGTPAEANAIFALALVQERGLVDRGAARVTYERYLAVAPAGPHVPPVREALCRLGLTAHCVQ